MLIIWRLRNMNVSHSLFTDLIGKLSVNLRASTQLIIILLTRSDTISEFQILFTKPMAPGHFDTLNNYSRFVIYCPCRPIDSIFLHSLSNERKNFFAAFTLF